MKTKALIDADFLLHRASCSVMQTVDIDDCKREQVVNPREGLQYIQNIIDKVLRVLQTDDCELFLSCGRSKSFRRKLAPIYKSNRDGFLRHLGIRTMREALSKRYTIHFNQELEADDLLGIEATTDDGIEKIIVGNDKDFKSIPCNYLCYVHMEDGVINTSVEEANLNHLIQTLAGDTADGYKGCPGIGKVKAERIAKEGWPSVVKAFIDAGSTEEEALLNARLAWILRKENIDNKGKVILWTPMINTVK